MEIKKTRRRIPLIVTLLPDVTQQEYFNQLRKKHYPAYANYTSAHLTLFHNLPSALPIIYEKLKAFSAQKTFILAVSGLQLYKTGVAFTLQSKMLQELHLQMQKEFRPWLITKDRQPLKPHITIQNKVTAYKAQQLYLQLTDTFKPFETKAIGFELWTYDKGPWKYVDRVLFTNE